MSAPVTREHRLAAAKLVKVRAQPRCVEQWIDGTALPYWAVEPFAEAVALAQAFADATQRERSWWETRIRQLISSAEEERYGGGPVVGAGQLEALIAEYEAMADRGEP